MRHHRRRHHHHLHRRRRHHHHHYCTQTEISSRYFSRLGRQHVLNSCYNYQILSLSQP